MNIGYLVNFKWYPPQGGAAVHAYQVAHQLARRGHAIKTISHWHEAPGLEVYRQRDLFRFLRDIDVLYIRLHGDWAFEYWTLLKVLTFFRLPVVWEINSPLEESIDLGLRTKRAVRHFNKQRRFLSKMVNAGICVSATMKDYATDYLGIKKTYVVPNGSDPKQFGPEKKDIWVYAEHQNYFKVLWSGSAGYGWQGIKIISEVAERIYALDKDIVFIFITNKKHLDKYAIFDKNVVVMDEKKYADLPPYIASADAGLCLYQNYGWNGRFYFSPLKLFDYMASGLPVIASNLGQIGEVIADHENGILTDNTITHIVNRIAFLKNNPGEAKRLGSNARARVEQYYNWERVADETENILKEVIN
jgi:glycosyltransferase involved in cell wall biosynthesis